MATIANLGVSLTARIGNFEKGFKRAQKIVDKHTQGTQAAAAWAAKWGFRLTAVATGALTYMVRKQIQAIDANAKLAQSLDTTVTGLINTQRAGELAGVAVEGIAQATKDLTRRLSQAAGNNGPAVKALERLNLTAQELQLLPLDERIAKINAAILEFIPAAERAAIAGQLFGEEGSIAMSRLSPDVIAQAAQEVRDMGRALSDVDAAMVEAANDAMTKVSGTVYGLGQQLTAQLAPYLKIAADRMFDLGKEGAITGETVSRAMTSIVNVVGVVGNGLQSLRIGLNIVQQGVLYFGQAFNKVFEIINKAVGSLIRNVSGNLNSLFVQLNKVLPEVMQIDLLPADNYFTRVGKEWEHGADVFGKMIEQNQQELSRLMAAPWVSDQLQQTWAEIKIQAEQFRKDIEGRVRPTNLSGAGTEAAGKVGEFRQVDLSRIAIGGPGGRGGAQKVEDPQLKTTNSILREIQISIGNPLVTA